MQGNVIKIETQRVLCRICKVEKPLSDFNRNYNYKSGRVTKCKECTREYITKTGSAKKAHSAYIAKLKANPEKYAKYLEKKTTWNKSERYYEGYYKKRFGISLSDVSAMLFNQNGLCANIGCSRPIALALSETQTKAVVDHRHATGKVRALLCVRCNTILGHVEKNRNLIPGLMNYLNKHN